MPLAFDETHYSFTVMETDAVNHMVGVLGVEGRPGLFWFRISGEAVFVGVAGPSDLSQGHVPWLPLFRPCVVNTLPGSLGHREVAKVSFHCGQRLGSYW